jgi:hypothetical protein
LENTPTAAPDLSVLPAIIVSPKEQLAALDAIGAHIGAAHVDAAIEHLRLELARRMLH